MAFGIKIFIQGDYALFTRPEMKVERVSYDVPTPSALVGLLSAVYWHPGVKYVIDKIVVVNPINFINIRRNEVSDKLPYSSVKKQMNDSSVDISMYTSEKRTQRTSMMLKDVCYGVEAHFELTEEKDKTMTDKKCLGKLTKRLMKGQSYTQPCLGCREFPAKVTLVKQLPISNLKGEKNLGCMLYDLQYKKEKTGKYTDDATPRFYRPIMVDGVIDVAKYAKELSC